MEIHQLESFLAVAELGTLTAASRRLHLTQPALSAQIKKLEEDLGARLFDRTPRGMKLNASGETFRPYARDALLTLDEGRRALGRLHGLEGGSIAIGGGATAITYLLPDILERFARSHPDVAIAVKEQGSARTHAMVLEGKLELGFVTLPLPQHHKIEVIPWLQDTLHLISPPDAPAITKLADLEGTPMVLFEEGTAIRAIIEARLRDAGVAPKVAMELRSIESIKRMVRVGVGAAFVSRFALGDQGGADRMIALEDDAPITRGVGHHPPRR